MFNLFKYAEKENKPPPEIKVLPPLKNIKALKSVKDRRKFIKTELKKILEFGRLGILFTSNFFLPIVLGFDSKSDVLFQSQNAAKTPSSLLSFCGIDSTDKATIWLI